jgi:adenine-specific DNA methylase
MRSDIEPIQTRIPAARQQDVRHYGVHPYFTRRPANVVREYIQRYSREGDLVLDPFGGTGVTAIEAYLLGRSAIQNDLNPFANFLSGCLVDPSLTSLVPLKDAFGRVEDACRDCVRKIELSEGFAESLLQELPLPENIALPRTSDAERFHGLFTPRQLAGLAVIKRAIDTEVDASVRNPLLLAWSAAVAKLNRTFLSAKGRAESRGGSSIFSIYRYKLAKDIVELPIWATFKGRFKNVLAAKKEILQARRNSNETSKADQPEFRVMAHDAATIDDALEPESVDYIFTDPPYGGFISYLDLSIMWNHWLGFEITEADRNRETIVGGELRFSEDHYKQSLARSIHACLRLLKPDRWISIVFQHWDVGYFETILQTATEYGAQLKAAITQTGDVVWSMHKKKNSASVLGGEMILTFYKPHAKTKRDQSSRPSSGISAESVLDVVFDELISDDAVEFTHESLFNRLIIELWKREALGCLKLDRQVFANALINRGWQYNQQRHQWVKNQKQPASQEPATLF